MFDFLRKKLKEKNALKKEHFDNYSKKLTKDATKEDLEKKKKQEEELRKRRNLF